MRITTRPHQPWHHLWKAHGHAVRAFSEWSGGALTILLIVLGVILLWIAFRGSNRVKAATAVWTLFP